MAKKLAKAVRVEKALTELIEISRAVGADPDLVQGGGGNTSVKTSDGAQMYVKASGAELAELDSERGWAAVDLAEVGALGGARELLKLDAAEREARVTHRLQAAVSKPVGARPSVETTIHALLGRVVIHTHPVHLNVLLCGKDTRDDVVKLVARAAAKAGASLPPLWMRYTDPGFVLGAHLAKEITLYAAEYGEAPAVVLLENHGLFVAADSVKVALALSSAITDAARRKVGGGRINPLPAEITPAAEKDLRADAELRGALLRAGCAPVLLTRDRTKLADGFVRDAECVRRAGRGALTPDQILYCREKPLVLSPPKSAGVAKRGASGKNGAAIEKAIARYRETHGADPRVIVQRDTGVWYAAPTPPKIRVLGEVYRAAMAAIVRRGAPDVKFLSRREADFVAGWDLHMPKQGSGRLHGRVALVTGAGSGLGKGIALGLASAGATIVGCDIDVGGLEEARDDFPVGRFIPVPMNVTSEESVDAAFARLEAEVGGIDILVNAAGIAPAFPLVDFPLGAWQKTLDLNLTGYFLCARAAARLMLRQDAGGSIINISSKSGLDASKSNSAYNATKAGEIHLMRGWALELGVAGIRVNAIAPGNVFKGSKIWNPEYIKQAAKKKGIKPEEVIPYYNSLSPLGQEIEPCDIAAAVLYLVSEEGRRVTGQTLVVDSGQVMVR